MRPKTVSDFPFQGRPKIAVPSIMNSVPNRIQNVMQNPKVDWLTHYRRQAATHPDDGHRSALPNVLPTAGEAL